ncbi:MAG: hypothetical protein ACO3FI_11525 [Cyclobacteriaceae bacterium]|jgi:hypothetical protein
MSVLPLKFIPSPVPLRYEYIYTATANKSGRMQYHRIRPGHTRLRISRSDFIRAYNELEILAIRPLQIRENDIAFQLEFYV